MTEILAKIKYGYYGGIYSDTYEEMSDGGPQCYESMSMQFRLIVTVFSVAYNVFIIRLNWPRVKQSKELDLTAVKDLNPSLFEKIVGYIFYLTYFIQAGYKFYTGRGIFMHNPCHYVLLFSAILLTTKKSSVTALLYVTYMRWLFGPYSAIVFPDLNGLDLPYEPEVFWLEHYFGAFGGPLILMMCGRYGFFRGESIKTIISQQLFGFSIHILYIRLFLMPQSIITWANLNFSLCRPGNDPTVPIWGNYYYLFADHYLNFASVLALLSHTILYFTVSSPIFLYQLIFNKKTNTQEKLKSQ